MKPKKEKNTRLKKIYLWHKRVGLFALVFVLMLSVTGILLNNADKFGIRKIVVSNSFVLGVYGMHAELGENAFRVADKHISQVGKNIFLETKRLDKLRGTLVAAVMIGGNKVIATPDSIGIYAPEGMLLEKLETESLPPGKIIDLGMAHEKLAIKTTQGTYLMDEEFVEWHVFPRGIPVIYANPVELPGELKETLLRQYRGEGLPLDRIILDIHSGKFFGKLGPVLMDLTAAGLIFLSLTGLVNTRSNAKRKRNRKR